MLDALYPEESRRNEIGTQIPFREEMPFSEEVNKKEEGGKKKGQTSQTIGEFDPFCFPFYLIYHRGLIFSSQSYHVAKVPAPAVIDP